MPITMAVGIGVLTGLFAGLFGVGGGVVLIPILVYFFHASQHQATGISLVALLLPVGAWGVWQYYKAGMLEPSQIRLGLWIALGIFLGAAVGAAVSVQISARVLQKAFAIFLVLVAAEMWFKSAAQ
jgi:uncharacterized protein